MKSDDREANRIVEQNNEESYLISPGGIPSESTETYGSTRGIPQINPIPAASDTSSSREVDKLAIERNTLGPYDVHKAFLEEHDELEDGLECRNQVKGYGSNVKSSSLDFSTSEPVLATEPIISTKETDCSTRLCSKGAWRSLRLTSVYALKFSASLLFYPLLIPHKFRFHRGPHLCPIISV